MKVKQSDWVVRKKYFKVKAVRDFRQRFVENYDGMLFPEDEGFIRYIESADHFYVYQFPRFTSFQTEEEADYFEKQDNNYVIKRDMFTVIGV